MTFVINTPYKVIGIVVMLSLFSILFFWILPQLTQDEECLEDVCIIKETVCEDSSIYVYDLRYKNINTKTMNDTHLRFFNATNNESICIEDISDGYVNATYPFHLELPKDNN